MKHDPNTCVFCLEFRKAMPVGKAGITEREAAGVLEETGDGGLMTATASRLLVQHGWRALPHPISEREEGARFAPPEGMR